MVFHRNLKGKVCKICNISADFTRFYDILLTKKPANANHSQANIMTHFTSEADRIIIQELERHTGERITPDKRISIPCPFHNETQPSLFITTNNKTKHRIGSYYCFGCGAKPSTHGGWNGLAKELGLATLDGDTAQITTYVRKPPLENTFDPEVGVIQSELLRYWNCELALRWPSGTHWRGVPDRVLQKIGAFLSFDTVHRQKVCIIPQYNGRILIGGVKALFDVKDVRVKYYSAPGPWVKTHALVPFHVASQLLEKQARKVVFLVEGSRDALRLLRFGIPAVAILGTRNWTEFKRDLLLSLDPDLVVVAMDNDSAGAAARDMIKLTLKGITHEVVDYNNTGVHDPGTATKELLKFWISKYRIETIPLSTLKDYYPV